MIVAKDQFLSWTMLSAQSSDRTTANEGRRYSFFQARYALYHSLGLLGIEPGSHVLAPAYICRAAIDPLVVYGLNVDFCAVKPDCSIDLQDLEQKITPETRAILVAHYFGFPQPLQQLRKLCDRHQLALIEDCAHVLAGYVEGRRMGTVGDASVFSWRKFLPIYDGGELVLNRPGTSAVVKPAKERALFTLKVAANMLDASLGRTRQPLLKLTYRGMRAGEALFRRYAKGRLRSVPMMQAEANSVSFNEESITWPMSRLSRWTKKHSDIENIIASRRRNFETLLAHLSSSRHVMPLFSSLPPAVCPWVFPVFFPDFTGAHLLLRDRGIPAVTWGGVRHPQVQQGRFKDSDHLYDNLVFLPVHQCLDGRDVDRIARAAKALCV